MGIFKRHVVQLGCGWFVGLVVTMGFAVRAADAAESKLTEKSRLKLKTERVIVFKDGYALVLKRGDAVTDDQGRVYTDEVPDAAESAPGVGLGLALCRQLAKTLGGRLSLQRCDGGAAFVLTLPRSHRASQSRGAMRTCFEV